MKVLITGGNGQLGRALRGAAPRHVKLSVFGSGELDITEPRVVHDVVRRIAPDYIINTAAYTAVDRAEKEEAIALAVNAGGVANLSASARAHGARLVQVSTDFVFGGDHGKPITPDSRCEPLGAYGRSKLAGEIAAGEDATIIRTAWVYSANGANFVLTMLRLLSERDELKVVADQVGTPTWATSLAEAIWKLVADAHRGIHHFTDSGVASWYDFAVAIQEEALALGLLEQGIAIVPIKSDEYPTPARRPLYSVLDKTDTFRAIGGPAPHWRINLRRMLRDLTSNG